MDTEKHSTSPLNKANEPKIKLNYKENSWHQWQCSGSSQIPSQDDNSHQFLSLYNAIGQKNSGTLLKIYDIENEKKEEKILNTELIGLNTCITQLPNGGLFCYGSFRSGITLIIDKNYRILILPSGTPCFSSSALYFDNNIYCFGGRNYGFIDLSRKFDLKNNRWINLVKLPETNCNYHSMIFNGNILISGYYRSNLWLYSIELDSFSIIPYDFASESMKVLINAEKLYLVELLNNGWIYESEDEYHWKPISKSRILIPNIYQFYCLYNKEKIFISGGANYYQFDLKKKILLEIK